MSLRKPYGDAIRRYAIQNLSPVAAFSPAGLVFVAANMGFCLRYLLSKKYPEEFWLRANAYNLLLFVSLVIRIRREKITHVHIHFGNTGEYFSELKKFCRIAIFVSFYGLDTAKHVVGTFQRVKRFADLQIALCNSMRDDLLEAGYDPKRVTVIPVALKFDELPVDKVQTSPRANRIVLAARLVEKKGIPEALSAFAATRAQNPDYTFTIAGDGPLRREAEQLAEKLGVRESVSFPGFLSSQELYDLLLQSKIFFLPSKTASNNDKEGTPVVLMEAQALGVPVVSTHHAGIPEIVRDGQTGILCPERDVECLSSALSRLMSDEEKWNDTSKAASAFMREEFDIEKVAKGLSELYNRFHPDLSRLA